MCVCMRCTRHHAPAAGASLHSFTRGSSDSKAFPFLKPSSGSLQYRHPLRGSDSSLLVALPVSHRYLCAVKSLRRANPPPPHPSQAQRATCSTAQPIEHGTLSPPPHRRRFECRRWQRRTSRRIHIHYLCPCLAPAQRPIFPMLLPPAMLRLQNELSHHPRRPAPCRRSARRALLRTRRRVLPRISSQHIAIPNHGCAAQHWQIGPINMASTCECIHCRA